MLMRSAAALVLAVVATLVAACSSGESAPPPPPPAPAFDTISVEVTQAGRGTVVFYDFDHGSTLMADGPSATRQAVPTTPFHMEVSKPHGPRDVRVKTLTWPGSLPVSCTIRVNGQVVAAQTGATAGDSVDCAYVGTP
jgi:hypothetical protein